MRRVARIITAVAAFASIAGCQFGALRGGVGYESGAAPRASAYETRVSIAGGGRVFTGIVVAVLLAEGVRYYVRGDDGTMTPLHDDAPPPDPGRIINEQDCTAPVDPA